MNLLRVRLGWEPVPPTLDGREEKEGARVRPGLGFRG